VGKRKMTPKQRVLKVWPEAAAYNRGPDDSDKSCWWQIWLPANTCAVNLLGMAKSARGAWADAARLLKGGR